jgi:hypothetical protein
MQAQKHTQAQLTKQDLSRVIRMPAKFPKPVGAPLRRACASYTLFEVPFLGVGNGFK